MQLTTYAIDNLRNRKPTQPNLAKKLFFRTCFDRSGVRSRDLGRVTSENSPRASSVAHSAIQHTPLGA